MSERGVNCTGISFSGGGGGGGGGRGRRGGLTLVWKGGKGFAFLNVDEKASDMGHDEVVERLRGMELDEQVNVSQKNK